MIRSIYIKDFAIIDELRLDFKRGLSIFIGETGAGKSIIVGAISLLCGLRADTSVIRSGKDKAIIEGVFELNDRIRAKLEEYSIDYDDELIIYRTISNDSKNNIRINNQSVTLTTLGNILEGEIDIHSQKDSQYLLKAQNHLKLLDLYLNRDDLKQEVSNAYSEYIKLKREYENYLNSNDSINDIEYFKYQIQEIEEANLNSEEEEELLTFEKRYKSYQKIIENLQSALSLYDETDGIATKLYEAIKKLNISDEEVDSIKEKINNSYYELEECFDSLRSILKSIDISESEIDHNQERLYTINKLKRKYKGDIESILSYKDELYKHVKAFEDREEILDKYTKDIQKALDVYLAKANILHDERLKAAKKLEERVIQEVEGLELKYFDFKISFKEKEYSSDGYEDVSFMICTNKGEELKPLIKVASGGEMSRILLALKSLFTSISNIGLVIFDEIDTGVSGKAALAIGKKMAKISKTSDVLAITHLAQVAAFGDNVYFVSKLADDKRTTSAISLLDKDRLIEELALMSSASTGENAQNSAKDLINQAQDIKTSL